MTFLDFMGKWEPVWLFAVLAIETWIGALTLYWVRKEFYYDKEKDDRRHKRTRTVKKTTTAPSGEIVTEESTETVESKGNENDKTEAAK